MQQLIPYVAILTHTMPSGETSELELTIHAKDARAAHAILHANMGISSNVRIYPATDTADGLARGALMVARRTAVNAIMRCGTPVQHVIERELASVNARCVACPTAEHIQSVLSEFSDDTQDCYGYAMQGLLDGIAAGESVSNQYHRAFLVLNAFVHFQKNASDREVSTEYILDGGGDIVSLGTAVAAIISNDGIWTPTSSGNMDAPTAARLGKAIADAMIFVTPIQRDIAVKLTEGCSQRQIAKLVNRNPSTINRNIAIMRSNIMEYFANNVPEFSRLIHAEQVEKMAARQKGDRHSPESREKYRANAAARSRAYRARKAAERAANRAI